MQKDTNDDLAALYMLKVQKTKDGIPYVAGIGAGIEDTDGQPLSTYCCWLTVRDDKSGEAATASLFVAQGNQFVS